MKSKRLKSRPTARLLTLILVLCVPVAGTAAAGHSPRGEIYGFAMADFGYNDGSIHQDWFDVVRPTQMPAGPDDLISRDFTTPESTYVSVRQSRLGVKGWFPTAGNELFTIFEFELFGVGSDAGETTFRLRHAYGEWGSFGAGQYWSAFMDINTFPNSQEYWGPSAMPFYRNVQLRWIPVKGDSHNLIFTLERPGASNDPNTPELQDALAERDPRTKYPIPDIAGAYSFTGDWGYVRLAGILRRIEWEDNTGDGLDLSDEVWGYGANVTANFNLGPNSSVLKLGLVAGEGIGNYLNDGVGDIAIDCEVLGGICDPATLSGETAPLVGVTAFYDLWWSERWSSTVGFSWLELDTPTDEAAPSNLAESTYALVNLQYHPAENLMFGGEIQYGERKNESDGWTYYLWRFQFSAKYSFSLPLGS